MKRIVRDGRFKSLAMHLDCGTLEAITTLQKCRYYKHAMQAQPRDSRYFNFAVNLYTSLYSLLQIWPVCISKYYYFCYHVEPRKELPLVVESFSLLLFDLCKITSLQRVEVENHGLVDLIHLNQQQHRPLDYSICVSSHDSRHGCMSHWPAMKEDREHNSTASALSTLTY